MGNFFSKMFKAVTHAGGNFNPAQKTSPLNPVSGPLAHKVVREIGRASYDAYPVTKNIPVIGTFTALGAATGYSLGGSYGTRHGEKGSDLWNEAGQSTLSLIQSGGGAAAAAVGVPPSVVGPVTNITKNITQALSQGSGGAGGGAFDLTSLLMSLQNWGGLFAYLEDPWDSSIPSVLDLVPQLSTLGLEQFSKTSKTSKKGTSRKASGTTSISQQLLSLLPRSSLAGLSGLI